MSNLMRSSVSKQNWSCVYLEALCGSVRSKHENNNTSHPSTDILPSSLASTGWKLYYVMFHLAFILYIFLTGNVITMMVGLSSHQGESHQRPNNIYTSVINNCSGRDEDIYSLQSLLLVSSRRPGNQSHFSSIMLSFSQFLVVKLNVLSLPYTPR